ncbi:hypothetical protein MSG28_013558, partial [Choristoneura fumiferana]
MAVKAEPIGPRNGHELAPLNTRADGSERPHGVTIVLQGSRGSLQREMPGEDRAAWSGKLQFFLSIIGYSVGLGNIWRFPYLCQQNGGGAFLIPFAVMLVLEGIPLFLIEMAIGQKMRLGSLGVWNTIHPWLGGIGISSCVVTLFVALYYNVIITWVFFYLFNSIRITLPWASCPSDNSTAQIECTKASATAYFWYGRRWMRRRVSTSPGRRAVFYSFGLAFGSLIAFGSYNPPDNNCVRDVLLVSVCNALTAIYASVVIFSILGFKAWTMAEKCITSSIEILAAHHVDGFLPNTTTEYYREHYDSLVKNNITTNLNLSDCSMGKQLNEIYQRYLRDDGLPAGAVLAADVALHRPFIVTCILLSSLVFMGRVVKTPYPDWVLLIALCMILAGVLPIPVVLLLRRFQCLAFDVDIHQGSIRRIETTVSTKEMMSDQDVLSPESAPPAQLFAEAATRFTIGDFDGADSATSGP